MAFLRLAVLCGVVVAASAYDANVPDSTCAIAMRGLYDVEVSQVAVSGSRVAVFNSISSSIQVLELGADGLERKSLLELKLNESIAMHSKVAVAVEGDVAFFDETVNLTRVYLGQCMSGGCLRDDFTAPGTLLWLGGSSAVTLDTNCSSVETGVCLAKHNISGATVLAELPAATVPSSVAVNGDTVAFAAVSASSSEGFAIFVRSAGGEVVHEVPYKGPGGTVRQLALIGNDQLAALVGDQVSIFARRADGSFAAAQSISNDRVTISEIRASDTKLAVAFVRNVSATLELYTRSAADSSKWTLETTFDNAWPWNKPEWYGDKARPSAPIMFDLDGDRVVYLTYAGGQSLSTGLVMTSPDNCDRVRVNTIIGIVLGAVFTVVSAVLLLRSHKPDAGEKKTIKNQRIQPAL
jgi:hypothetical protein